MKRVRSLVLAVTAFLMVFTGCSVKLPEITLPTITAPTLTAPSLTIPTPTAPSQPGGGTTTVPSPAVKTTVPSPAVTTTTPEAPAKVAGLVYYRDPAVSFPVDAAPADLAIEGARVTIDEAAVVTAAGGRYDFTSVPAGYHTIAVTLDGYIPTQVSWTLLPGQSYVFNIGLYRAPATVSPRPGFVNGIITWDAGGWLIDYYYNHGLFPPTYAAARAQAGGSLVTVSDPVFASGVSASHVTMGTQASPWWRMMNETEYAALVADAHARGLQFMLWLGVIDGNDPSYWDLVYSGAVLSESFWDDWFRGYETYAVQYAAMAEKLGIEYVNLGHDMGYAIGGGRFTGGDEESLARWTDLVNAVRAVYHGKVTYFGGVDVIHDYYEDDGYPAGFVGLLDAVGINIQSVSPDFNPDLDTLKTALGGVLDRYTGWTCPVFIMVRTPSVDGGTSFEDFMEPLLEVNHAADGHTMNVWQQADLYEALYEVVSERPAGDGQVGGIFSWGYNYLDDYLTVKGQGPYGTDAPMAMDKSGNIRGKPAEAVMRFWAGAW